MVLCNGSTFRILCFFFFFLGLRCTLYIQPGTTHFTFSFTKLFCIANFETFHRCGMVRVSRVATWWLASGGINCFLVFFNIFILVILRIGGVINDLIRIVNIFTLVISVDFLFSIFIIQVLPSTSNRPLLFTELFCITDFKTLHRCWMIG